MSKRSGIPNGVEQTAKETIQEPRECYTPSYDLWT